MKKKIIIPIGIVALFLVIGFIIFDNNKIEFDVAGTRHCLDEKKCKDIISINDKLELQLEPDNEYDKYAIRVILTKNGKNYHLGYVPRYYSKEL